MFLTLETLRISALLLAPIIPRASQELLEVLAVKEPSDSVLEACKLVSGAPAEGTSLRIAGPGRRLVLFPRETPKAA